MLHCGAREPVSSQEPADRVRYPPDRIAKIAAEASKKNSLVSLEDKLGLLSDSLALARAGYAETSSVLDLIKGFKSEDRCKLRTNSVL